MSLAAFRDPQEGRSERRRVGRDFAWIPRESRTINWQLTGSSIFPLVEAMDSSISGHFSHTDSGLGMAPENRLFLAEIQGQKDGRPHRWRIGKDIPMIARESPTIKWQLTGHPFWALIAAKHSSISAHLVAPLPDRKWLRI